MVEVKSKRIQHVRSTAQSFVELTAGVLGTDAASLWWYDDEQAYLVARYPEDRMPGVKTFSDMPDVGRSILAGETEVYVRSDSTGTVREWMDRAGIEVSVRLPVETPEVPRHFLGLSWSDRDHPPVESILPTARRFADHIALALTRLAEKRARMESALELSDNVAQALVLARSALQFGRTEDATAAIDRAFEETQRIMGRLLREDGSGNLRRLYASGANEPDDVAVPSE